MHSRGYTCLLVAVLLGLMPPMRARAQEGGQEIQVHIALAIDTLSKIERLIDSIERRHRDLGATASPTPGNVTGTAPPAQSNPSLTPNNPLPGNNVQQSAFVSIDLGSQANQKLDNNLDGTPGNDLKNVPRGEATLGTSPFRIGESMIHLRGTATPALPIRVNGIPINTPFVRLHVLHSTGFRRGNRRIADGTEIGAYVLHYTDGTADRMPIRYGEDLRDWWDSDAPNPSRVQVMWTGTNAAVEKRGRHIRLFVATWDNPHPEKQVTSLDYVSDVTACDPFLVALSVQRRPVPADAQSGVR